MRERERESDQKRTERERGGKKRGSATLLAMEISIVEERENGAP